MRIGAYKYFVTQDGFVMKVHVNNDVLEILEDLLEPATTEEIENSTFKKDLENLNDS